MKCEIGFAVWVLTYRKWGSTPINGRPRSQNWWIRRLDQLTNEVEEPILAETLAWLGESNVEIPIPFEVEMGMPDLNYDILIKAWRRMENRHA